MKYFTGASFVIILSMCFTTIANAAFVGRFPATPNGTDYQAYYDNQLNITWLTDSSVTGQDTWSNQAAWAANFSLEGYTEWRLASMDLNGDGTVYSCTMDTPPPIEDNEYCYMYEINGVTASNPGPFSNLQPDRYWSGTERAPLLEKAYVLDFSNNSWGRVDKSNLYYAWAVHDGDIGAIPIPASWWLFISGLIALIGINTPQTRRKT